MKKEHKVFVHRGWADVGSHGGIFFFDGGRIGDLYPGMFHIYRTQITPDLIEVEIRAVHKKNKMVER